MEKIFITNSAEETEALARSFAGHFKPGDVLYLQGEFGSGKTTFVKGLAQGLGVPSELCVHSPTFTLMQDYPGKQLTLCHVDLYRLENLSEIEELGLWELKDSGRILLAIEWAERLAPDYFENPFLFFLSVLSSHQRQIVTVFPYAQKIE